jgi:hypothetical protein
MKMTERQRDERDLKILRDYESTTPRPTVVILAHRHSTTQRYVKTLLREALFDD